MIEYNKEGGRREKFEKFIKEYNFSKKLSGYQLYIKQNCNKDKRLGVSFFNQN